MTWPTIFANLASGNQNLALFDAMFAQVAQIVAIPCTASGANSIVLTPIGSNPTIAAYAELCAFRFKAVGNSSGNVSVQFGALSSLLAYKSDGVTRIGNGDLLNGIEYVAVYTSSLNSGSGGVFIENASIAAVTVNPGGSLINEVIVNNAGTPNSQIDVSYDECVMVNASGIAIRAVSQSFTINFLTQGANGQDNSNALAANTWYFGYSISNGSTTAGLVSTSATAPTFPSGYSYKKLIFAWRTNGTPVLYGARQRNRVVEYVYFGSGVAGTTAANTLVINGVVGTFSLTSPTMANQSLAPAGAGSVSLIPPNNCSELILTATAVWQNNTTSNFLVGPANYFNGGAALTNLGPEGSASIPWPIAAYAGAAVNMTGRLVNEGSTVAAASSAAGFGLWCTGYVMAI